MKASLFLSLTTCDFKSNYGVNMTLKKNNNPKRHESSEMGFR